MLGSEYQRLAMRTATPLPHMRKQREEAAIPRSRLLGRYRMTYKVRLWVEDGVVKCCSGVCTEISCPRVRTCKETEIKEITYREDCKYAEWFNGKCLGISVSQDYDETCDDCKVCPHYESYEDEDIHEDYSDTLPCGCCACCGCSCDERWEG